MLMNYKNQQKKSNKSDDFIVSMCFSLFIACLIKIKKLFLEIFCSKTHFSSYLMNFKFFLIS